MHPICPVCLNNIIQPCIGSCAHHLCYACILDVAKKIGKCPLCKITIREIRYDTEFAELIGEDMKSPFKHNYSFSNKYGDVKLTFINNKKGPGVRLIRLLYPPSRSDVSVIPINSVIIAINNVPTTDHASAIRQFDALTQMGSVINFTIIK